MTGAASGLGLAMARLFVAEGMHVVLADLPGERLDAAVQSFDAGQVTAVPTDVSDPGSMAQLAERVRAEGGVDLLCNNAGITGDLPRCSWEHDLANWRRVLDVNLLGVVNGLHSFVPMMLEQGREGHIVNTASMGGLMALPSSAPTQQPRRRWLHSRNPGSGTQEFGCRYCRFSAVPGAGAHGIDQAQW